MNAETIARALGGRRTGLTWMVPCPAHNDAVPSLAIRDGEDGKVLVKCHAGCPQTEVIARLRAKGLWHGTGSAKSVPVRSTTQVAHEGDAARKADMAMGIWRSARPAAGTPVETYLASRGLRLGSPPTLRFHAGLKHPSGGSWLAMVALVSDVADKPIAIHRTFLRPDGSSKAPVVPQKMMLGPCRGGAVRLATGDGVLMVGEGIESSLAGMQATGRPAWAALSTAGLRGLDLPDDLRHLTILADGDPPGEAAARDAAGRWLREGRAVRIARAPAGKDFNDVLLGHVTAEVAP